ncbi:lipocalin family protein [Ferruginibacter sp.]
MKKTFLIMTAAVCLMFTSSCKKDKEASRSELLQGTWHVSAMGQDDNMNGTLEVSEYDPIPAGSSLTETFNADHSGSATLVNSGVTTTSSFTWQLQSNDQQLLVTTTASGTSSTTTSQISLLSSTQLMGYDITSSPRTIILMVK